MSRRDENAIKAKSWLKTMGEDEHWSKLIEKAKNRSHIYRDRLISDVDRNHCEGKLGTVRNISIVDDTSYGTLVENFRAFDCVCLLNFASYYRPGGGFLKGSYSQEESLCHVSGLYPVLKAQHVYRDRAKETDTPCTYKSEVIYSVDVPFTTVPDTLGSPMLVDVLSCAAPNCNKVPISKRKLVEEEIAKRLEACYLIPYMNGTNVLILGAWGCGVFKNDVAYVAHVFSELNKKYGSLYEKVIYAIPNQNMRNTFEQVFKCEA